MDYTYTMSAELASGISWATLAPGPGGSGGGGADVINCSWGDKNGRYFNYMNSTILETAINNALTYGRGGKGCVVVFSSGNWGGIDYPAYCNDNILVVGSIDSTGHRSVFDLQQSSGYGAKLDVVAPGSNIRSTLNGNVTGTMSGTSFAAPHVAGIAALILSVRPDLMGQQVRDAIETTCSKLSGYSYTNNPAVRPNGTWESETGYGLVNAYNAVYSVMPRIDGPNEVCYSGSTFTLLNPPSGNIYWTVSNTGLFTVASTTGNTKTVTRIGTGSGSATLTARIGSIYGAEVASKTITACNNSLIPVITGFTPMCSGTPKTFSATNFQQGYSWDKGGYLSLSSTTSNTTTVSVTAGYVDFESWVSVKNSSGVELVKYNLWIGRPVMFVSGPTYVTVGEQYYYSVYPTSSYAEPLSNYTWYTSPSSTNLQPNVNRASIWFYSSGSYMVSCRTTNACGIGNYADLLVSSSRGGSASIVNFYPNPVSDILYVELNPPANLKAPPTYDLRLYDGQGNLLQQRSANGGTVQFNVSTLPDGIYYLHIYDGVSSTPEMQQIVVEH